MVKVYTIGITTLILLFGLIILESRKLRIGRRTKMVMQVAIVVMLAYIGMGIVYPRITADEQLLAQEVRKSLIQQYSKEISEANYRRDKTQIKYGKVGSSVGGTEGTFMYEVVDLHGNHWEWLVEWKRTRDGVKIIEAHEI